MSGNDPINPDHYVQFDHSGWGCSCGAGRHWPLAPVGRARAAADRHLLAQWKRQRARPVSSVRMNLGYGNKPGL